MVLATKSKSIKYSFLTKAICFILSIVMFVLFAYNTIIALMPLSVFDYLGVVGNTKINDFYSLSKVGDRVFYNASALPALMYPQGEELDKYIEDKREDVVQAQLNKFLDGKVEIIKGELEYVVHYADNDNTDIYENTGVSDYYVNSIPDTPPEKQMYTVDPYAPNSVRAAQKILNYAQGQEFLKYADLVREEALSDVYYNCECEIEEFHYSITTSIAYNATTQAAKEMIEKCFSSVKGNIIEQISDNYKWAEKQLKQNENMFYYVKKGDKVISNISSFEKELENISEHSNYFYKDGTKNTFTYTSQNFYHVDLFSGCDKVLFYFSEPENIKGNDDIAELYKDFQQMNYNIYPYFIRAVAFLLASVTALVILLVLSGHKNGKEGITLAFIDKLPGDIHIALTIGVGIGIICLFAEVFDFDNALTNHLERYILIGSMTCGWGLIVELAASITRIAKSDKSYFGSYITVKLAVAVFKFFKKLFVKVKESFNNVFAYKPRYFKQNVILGVIVYTLIKAILVFLSACIGIAIGVFVMLLFVVLDFVIAFRFAKYAEKLDKIIIASTERKSADFGNEKVDESLVILNNSLRVTNEEFATAVENAIKNERTKAELITNVSHDLKTPLTSIISYIGLLKECDIKDRDAQKYIEILNEKSYNLKSLFENLIEASKVSAGNIKLNKTSLNLKELIVQAIVEYAPEFEERNLDLKFNENTSAINIFADGQRTYRIIENLLSNAKKYSAPGTRVYASIREENGYGIFEIKNISREPLDISPEELTERFVRGDASRGEEEGNGLGLSIAKELCILQNGALDIKIDGDLFKATVYLPKQ